MAVRNNFPTRDDYYAAVRPRRIKWLRSELAEYRARYVICYGKGNWDRYEGIFPDVEFKPELDNHIRAGYVGDCTILLLPFFSYYYVTVELIGQIANMFGQVNKKGP